MKNLNIKACPRRGAHALRYAETAGNEQDKLEQSRATYLDRVDEFTIEDRLGMYYRDAGYFSLALDRWENGWKTAKDLTRDK